MFLSSQAEPLPTSRGPWGWGRRREGVEGGCEGGDNLFLREPTTSWAGLLPSPSSPGLDCWIVVLSLRVQHFLSEVQGWCVLTETFSPIVLPEETPGGGTQEPQVGTLASLLTPLPLHPPNLCGTMAPGDPVCLDNCRLSTGSMVVTAPSSRAASWLWRHPIFIMIKCRNAQ